MPRIRYVAPLFALVLLVAAPSALAESHTVGCFIDTPAYDTPTANNCYLLGSSPSSASFEIMTLSSTSGYTITWTASGCSGLWCTVPISPGQNKTVGATIKNNSTNETTYAEATAHYIYEPGW